MLLLFNMYSFETYPVGEVPVHICAVAAAAAALAVHALSASEGLPLLRFPSWGCMLWMLQFFGLVCGLCCWMFM